MKTTGSDVSASTQEVGETSTSENTAGKAEITSGDDNPHCLTEVPDSANAGVSDDMASSSQAAPLTLLYQDDVLLAVHKPAGMLVHRSRVDRYETRFLLQTVRDQVGRRVYPLHRLDKPTCGIVLMALNPDIARVMGAQFEAQQVQKTYWAIVRGYTAEHAVIDYPLREKLDPATDGRARPNKPAQAAVTEYRRLATLELPVAVGRYPTARYSWLAVVPRSGRKHQIRRHMKHIFHPVVGDTTYGDGKHNHCFRQHLHCHDLLLCARSLCLTHPVSGQMITVTTEPDMSMRRILAHPLWRRDG